MPSFRRHLSHSVGTRHHLRTPAPLPTASAAERPLAARRRALGGAAGPLPSVGPEGQTRSGGGSPTSRATGTYKLPPVVVVGRTAAFRGPPVVGDGAGRRERRRGPRYPPDTARRAPESRAGGARAGLLLAGGGAAWRLPTKSNSADPDPPLVAVVSRYRVGRYTLVRVGSVVGLGLVRGPRAGVGGHPPPPRPWRRGSFPWLLALMWRCYQPNSPQNPAAATPSRHRTPTWASTAPH